MEACTHGDRNEPSAPPDGRCDDVENSAAGCGVRLSVSVFWVLRCVAESGAARVLRGDGVRRLLRVVEEQLGEAPAALSAAGFPSTAVCGMRVPAAAQASDCAVSPIRRKLRSRGRKISWTLCRIPVRPFVYIVTAGQPRRPGRKGPILQEETMRKQKVAIRSFALLVVLGTAYQALARDATTPYPNMAPIEQYLMDRTGEIALARSAAPSSISDGAEVMLLGREGYETAVKGTNGFLCIVARSWAQNEDNAEFWNPKMRAPHCFNAQAARSFAPIYLMKTRLVLAGKSKAEIAQAIATALDNRQLPALEPGAMAYMMSKQQYLNDRGKSWHPHVMFYSPGDMTKNWAADDPNSPVMVNVDREDRVTVLFILADKWSDGSAAPSTMP